MIMNWLRTWWYKVWFRTLYVEHHATWVNAPLRYNAAGDTKPGFMCVHVLENGRGICGGNVFELKKEENSDMCGCTCYVARWRPRQWYEHRAR